MLQRALAVVGAGVDVDDLELLFQQLDGRQDAVAMQPVRVQLIGVKVRRGDDAHAVGEHRVEQAMQDHRVGHVCDVELVEADQAEAPRDALAELIQRVDGALELLQLAVHLAHELMEVQARLARQRHGLRTPQQLAVSRYRARSDAMGRHLRRQDGYLAALDRC